MIIAYVILQSRCSALQGWRLWTTKIFHDDIQVEITHIMIAKIFRVLVITILWRSWTNYNWNHMWLETIGNVTSHFHSLLQQSNSALDGHTFVGLRLLKNSCWWIRNFCYHISTWRWRSRSWPWAFRPRFLLSGQTWWQNNEIPPPWDVCCLSSGSLYSSKNNFDNKRH